MFKSKSKQVAGGVVIAGALAFVALLGPVVGASPLANTASANYGGGGGGGTKRVEICREGRTIRVAARAVEAQIASGATRGECPATPAVLGEATTAEQEEIVKLQVQLISLLQQLLQLLSAK